jgi:hypothetical protein
MSYLLNFNAWDKLFEADAISNATYRIAFTGSTPSKAPNKSALQEFMGAVTTPVIDSDKMDDTKAVAKIVTGNSAQTKVIPKTVKATNYLKLGDKLLNGDSGKGTTITVTKEELMRSSFEASGNGIFSLGRALALLPKLITGQQIIIGMNNPTADSVMADAKTGMQDVQAKFSNSCLSTLIVSKAIIPSELNITNNVTVYRDLSNKSEYINLAKKRANIDAMPSLTLTPEMKTTLTESFTIDTASLVDSIKDKKLTRYDEATKGLINDYVNQVFEKHVSTTVDRFKKYLEVSAASAGVSPTIFAGIYGYLDTWKKAELAKKQEYLQSCQSRVMGVFSKMSDGKQSTRSVATANAKVIKGTEGKL